MPRYTDTFGVRHVNLNAQFAEWDWDYDAVDDDYDDSEDWDDDGFPVNVTP